jgi:hypothetical protein
MANVYRSWSQIALKVFMYDKIKNFFMPYDYRKYSGFDLLWRQGMAGALSAGFTLLFSYPFDLAHTRITTDMSKQNQKPLFTSTFNCFNRTHIDEGRFSLLKGFEFALLSAVLRGCLTLPIYDRIKQNSFMKQH